MTDLVARWRSPEFVAAATRWVDEVLAGRGLRRAGPLAERTVRFWAGVYEVPLTGGGHAFVKVGNPGQAFEGPLLAVLARIAPDLTVRPWSVDPVAGWWLLPDAGPSPEPTEQTWGESLELTATMQRACADRVADLAMVPTLDADGATAYAVRLVEELARRPESDPQHVGPELARSLLAGAGRLADAMAVLAGSGLPPTLQPADVHPGNTGRGPDGRLRLFDLGDAFVSHPWAVLAGPVRGVSGVRLREPLPDTPAAGRILDRYAEHWPDVGRGDRHELWVAADRLGSLHRAASWQRLLAPADPDRLGVPAPYLADWLRLALA